MARRCCSGRGTNLMCRSCMPSFTTLADRYTQMIRRAVSHSAQQFVERIANPATPRQRTAAVFRDSGRVEAAAGRSLKPLQTALRHGWCPGRLRAAVRQQSGSPPTRRPRAPGAPAWPRTPEDPSPLSCSNTARGLISWTGETAAAGRRLHRLRPAQPAARPGERLRHPSRLPARPSPGRSSWSGTPTAGWSSPTPPPATRTSRPWST